MFVFPLISALFFSLNTEKANSFVIESAAHKRTIQRLSASAEEGLERFTSQLKRLEKQIPAANAENPVDDLDFDSVYQSYARMPANSLKVELKRRMLPVRGRKPDLARRLAEYDIQQKTGQRHSEGSSDDEVQAWNPEESRIVGGNEKTSDLEYFCGMKLSMAARSCLEKANFNSPTPIQQEAIPLQLRGESMILHAETGSGKTLAYLLPITEKLWAEHIEQRDSGYGIILAPTRELAAQVAGIATVLAPPGSVRLVSRPTNLMSDGLKERGESEFGGRLEAENGRAFPRLFIGSSKAIMHSLYGDGKMPASPTTKPEAMHLLRNVRWLVLDEVDRLLNVRKKHGNSSQRHEKPAAVVTSAIARLTLGRAQVVSASATVGRNLKRELSRVLGLSPKEWPQVVRGEDKKDGDEEYDDTQHDDVDNTGRHIGRAVTIPDTVKNLVVPVDTSSTGKVLTSAFFVIKNLNKTKGRKILLVLTRGSGLKTKQAIGALNHFRCKPEPVSLLDALEADGTDHMIEKHRQVSGAAGVGESIDEDGGGYLLVTGEDTVRGLHLDGLDVVVVVGRANGPDEYTHIAGRTGRAGKNGLVINVLSDKHAMAVKGWEKMLGVDFNEISEEDVKELD